MARSGAAWERGAHGTVGCRHRVRLAAEGAQVVALPNEFEACLRVTENK